MKGYSDIFKEKIKEKEVKNKNQFESNNFIYSNYQKDKLINQGSIHKYNKFKKTNCFNNNFMNDLLEWQKSNEENEINDNNLEINNYNKKGYEKDSLIQKPSVSFISNNKNNSYQNSNYNLKKWRISDNNRRLNNIFDNINPEKEIVYNFGYRKQDRLMPLKLNLIEDTIKDKDYENNKREKENLKKNFEKIYSNDSKKKKNYFIGEKIAFTKKNNFYIKTNNYEYLSKAVDQELNITKNQMNILDKEADILYNKYKENIKEKSKLIKNGNYSKNNKFFSKQGINIIRKSKCLNNKLKIYNEKEIKIPIPLLISSINNKNKRNLNKNNYCQRDNYFSPKEKKGIYFFQNFNNNIIKRNLQKNYSEIYENKNTIL